MIFRTIKIETINEGVQINVNYSLYDLINYTETESVQFWIEFCTDGDESVHNAGLRFVPFNSITHFERKPRPQRTISATKSVSKYQYWWSFVTLELSLRSFYQANPTENRGRTVISIYARCFETRTTFLLSFFFFPLLPRSTFPRFDVSPSSRAVYAHQEFLFRFGLPNAHVRAQWETAV